MNKKQAIQKEFVMTATTFDFLYGDTFPPALLGISLALRSPCLLLAVLPFLALTLYALVRGYL